MPSVTFVRPGTRMTGVPAVATAAPIVANRSAWLDEVGGPRYHVNMSQRMAEARATATVTRLTASGFTRSLPIVVATAVPDRAPTKLSVPAISTAMRGLSTRVATIVAMA